MQCSKVFHKWIWSHPAQPRYHHAPLRKSGWMLNAWSAILALRSSVMKITACSLCLYDKAKQNLLLYLSSMTAQIIEKRTKYEQKRSLPQTFVFATRICDVFLTFSHAGNYSSRILNQTSLTIIPLLSVKTYPSNVSLKFIMSFGFLKLM